MIGVVRAAQNRQRQLLTTATVGTTAGAQSYTFPVGTQYADIETYGGGGGGGAANTVAVGRTNYYVGGGGGGGGGYVRYGLTAFGGDVLNFTIGSGGTGDQTTRGSSGGNTSITSLNRSGEPIFSFSNLIAYGGFGGERATTISMIPRGGTGGQVTGGNISNRAAANGSNGGLTSVTSANGGGGGAGGQSDKNVEDIFNLILNGGDGGIASSDTRATVGSNGLTNLMGAGGGGGGYFKSGTVAAAYKGATGGVGGIRIRAYG